MGAEIESLLRCLLVWRRLLAIVIIVGRSLAAPSLLLPLVPTLLLLVSALLLLLSTLLLLLLLTATLLLLLMATLLLLISTLLLLIPSSVLIAGRPATLLLLVALLLRLIRRTTLSLILVLPWRPVVACLLRRRATALSHEWVLHLWRRWYTGLKSFGSGFHGSPSSRTGLVHFAPTAGSFREIPLSPSHIHTSIS
jgi:hypothetical protein